MVLSAKVNGETRALLLYLALKMTSRGEVTPGTWDELATTFGVHKRRIAERFQHAQDAGLITRVAGGWNGTPAVWQAVLNGAATQHQTRADRCGSAAPNFRTKLPGVPDAIGAADAHPMTRAYVDAPFQRNDNERDSRTSNAAKDRDDEEVARALRLVAASPRAAGSKAADG